MTWEIVLQIAAIGAVGIGTYAAIRADLAVMHANMLNMKEKVKDLEKDVRRHDRTLASMDRRSDSTGNFPAASG